MKRPSESAAVSFLYRTRTGHALLKWMMALHIDRLAVWFLRSRASRLVLPSFLRTNQIDLSLFAETSYDTYRDLFLRHKKELIFDGEETSLVSPCDGYLTAYRIGTDSAFRIKGTRYTVRELLGTDAGASYEGGAALVFRLSASDYHYYHYFADCTQGAHHFIEGTLHSVQPAALSAERVFVRNRRTWSVLETAHFGRVIQIEVGAFIVGGIVNHFDADAHPRGAEKGHFDLAGSTIVLLLEKDRIRLRGEFRELLSKGKEVRVETGMRIGSVP